MKHRLDLKILLSTCLDMGSQKAGDVKNVGFEGQVCELCRLLQ